MTTMTSVGAGIWTADLTRTRAAFAARHLFGQTVHGTIAVTGGTLDVDPDGQPVRFRASLDPASIDTGNARRDADLRGRRFLGVETYPLMEAAADRIDVDRRRVARRCGAPRPPMRSTAAHRGRTGHPPDRGPAAGERHGPAGSARRWASGYPGSWSAGSSTCRSRPSSPGKREDVDLCRTRPSVAARAQHRSSRTAGLERQLSGQGNWDHVCNCESVGENLVTGRRPLEHGVDGTWLVAGASQRSGDRAQRVEARSRDRHRPPIAARCSCSPCDRDRGSGPQAPRLATAAPRAWRGRSH